MDFFCLICYYTLDQYDPVGPIKRKRRIHMMKKLLSILLVCAMMISLIPMYASAEAEDAEWNRMAEAIGQPAATDDATLVEAYRSNLNTSRAVGDNSFYESEPNDGIDYVNIIYSDYTVSGNVYGYDLDFFEFTLSQPSDVAFIAASPTDSLSFGIFNETGDVCLWVAEVYYDSEYGYYNYLIDHYLTNGTYYLVVLDNNQSSAAQEYMFYYLSAVSSTAHTHNYTWDQLFAYPTCTTDGAQIDFCNCGAYWYHVLPANGHTWDTGTVTLKPTCTSIGNKLLTCYDCGATTTEVIPASPHNFVNGYCSVCGTREPLFPDAPWGQYYSTPIEWAVNAGITTGYPNGLFGTEDTCSRGQVVTFLWRAAGCPAPTSTSHSFTDIEPGQYYYNAVLWAVEKGITTGLSATTFGPNDPCNRGQVVTFLWRYAGKPAPSSYSHSFTDVDSAQFYFVPMLWAYEKGITTGTSATTFSPANPCTRGQVVTFLYRAVA